MAEGFPEFLYHYTNVEGLEGILRSRRIMSSTSSASRTRRDALYGEGVYLTSLPPDSGRNPILANNYNDGVVRWNEDRADCYVKFRTRDLRSVARKVNSRDVWLVQGDIDLREYDYWYFYQEALYENYLGQQVNRR